MLSQASDSRARVAADHQHVMWLHSPRRRVDRRYQLHAGGQTRYARHSHESTPKDEIL